MSKRDFKRDSSIGAGNRRLLSSAPQQIEAQQAYYIALAQTAYARLQRRQVAMRASGELSLGFLGVVLFCRDMCRHTSALARITPKQIAALERACGGEAVEYLKKLYAPSPTPFVLQNLPKRPPKKLTST